MSAVTQLGMYSFLFLVMAVSGEDTRGGAKAEPRDCAEVRAQGHTTSGVYTVYIGESQRPLAVYCDMTTGSVGWTVFQRRTNGTQNFNLNWRDYQNGFGSIHEEFWIGNDNLHLITTSRTYKLRVELTAFDGETAYAEFNDFKVSSGNYKLIYLGRYSGTAGDSLSHHVGERFSTKDNDNDSTSYIHCAVFRKGAWWYSNCGFSNLNGHYYQYAANDSDGVNWHTWKNRKSLKGTEMKLTPFN